MPMILHLRLHHLVPQLKLVQGSRACQLRPLNKLVANANEEAATSNPPLVIEEPVGEVSSGVTVRTLIDLEEELVVVTDTNLST